MNPNRMKKKPIAVISPVMALIMICFYLATLNFIDRYFYCLFIAAAVFLLTPGRKLRLNGSFFLLMVFAIAILLFEPGSRKMATNMIKPFTYPLCYLMGASVFSGQKDENKELLSKEKNTSGLIYVLTAGAMTHFLLNMSLNKSIEDRNVIDFWTGKAMAATGQAAIAVLAIGVVMAFLFSKVSRKKKLIAIALLIVIISYNLVLAGRTIFVMLALVAAAALLCSSWLDKKNLLKRLIPVAIVVLVILALYNADAFGMRTSIESSNFYYRFFGDSYSQDLEDDSRMTYKLAYLKYVLSYPWGGNRINELVGHHAHDLYLDVYSEAGIFATLSIASYVILSLMRVIKCLKHPDVTVPTKMLVFCVFLACNVQFWLEPITKGMPWLLAAYCLMDGGLTYLLSGNKQPAAVR